MDIQQGTKLTIKTEFAEQIKTTAKELTVSFLRGETVFATDTANTEETYRKEDLLKYYDLVLPSKDEMIAIEIGKMSAYLKQYCAATPSAGANKDIIGLNYSMFTLGELTTPKEEEKVEVPIENKLFKSFQEPGINPEAAPVTPEVPAPVALGGVTFTCMVCDKTHATYELSKACSHS